MWTFLFWTIFLSDINKPQIEVWGIYESKSDCIAALEKRAPEKASIESQAPNFAVYWKTQHRWIGLQCVESGK